MRPLCAVASVSMLEIEQGFGLGGADEVVLRQAADGMRAELDQALVVADLQVRMVVFAMRNPRQGIDERHGLVIVAESVSLEYSVAGHFPSRQLLEQGGGFGLRERRHAAFA